LYNTEKDDTIRKSKVYDLIIRPHSISLQNPPKKPVLEFVVLRAIRGLRVEGCSRNGAPVE
jgi:hypothetical protein